MRVKTNAVNEKVVCHHCGDLCSFEIVYAGEKPFCCTGCKSVYNLLEKNNLCDYYRFSENAGLKQNTPKTKKFTYLDEPEAQKKFLISKVGSIYTVRFYVPVMHCASCIWLLEHLNKINSGILSGQVQFLKKEVLIRYDANKIALSDVASILQKVGYEPWLSLTNPAAENKQTDKSVIYKIGITGFCFANIMMLSFPEYFSSGFIEDLHLLRVFSFLNLFLAIPVLFFGASEFFISGWKGIRNGYLNIDAPIALAVLITFLRSAVEIISGSGAGFLDSMSGIVFFMLLGRYFQNKTHETLSFSRDYQSYFPLGVTLLDEEKKETQCLVSQLRRGMRIKIHDGEIIPVDSILFYGKANLDYSFVTGESNPVTIGIGEIIYAGAKQCGGALELEVIRELDHSYLISLWNQSERSSGSEEAIGSLTQRLSRYFATFLLVLAIATFVYWQIYAPDKSWQAFTAVLIVACPCTLLLSSTFTFGTMQNKLAKVGFFVKNSKLLEAVSSLSAIVFDKTGTLTESGNFNVDYHGKLLTEEEKSWVSVITAQSLHPFSRAIFAFLKVRKNKITLASFSELPGSGVTGCVDSNNIVLGSRKFIHPSVQEDNLENGSEVLLLINGDYKGRFILRSSFRQRIQTVFQRLSLNYNLFLLSGDHHRTHDEVQKATANKCSLIFNAAPHEKMKFITELKETGKKVMMIGDGLNDAGALAASDFGVVVTDSLNNFTPASHAIISGSSLKLLPEIIAYCRKSNRIILVSFAFSLLYNAIGLSFAVQAQLKPVIAAILMPVSSITIILLTWMISSLMFIPVKKSAE
jgi:P-type Cu+ transporter